MMMNERVVETFVELVKIDSEAKDEGKFQTFLKTKFEDFGLNVYEDNTMEQTGLGANNLLCTLKGEEDRPSLFFSAHVDTVAPGKGINPQIREGVIYSDGTTILAADNKAGIAVMLELIEELQEGNIPHGTIEFILTPGEEIGLIGAKGFDMTKMVATQGFVLDSGGPVGSIVMSSPTLMGLEVDIAGVTAHAGLEPEKGVSAIEIAAKAISNMKLGRLDVETTANIGTINGGVASNIVADKVNVTAEARSVSQMKCEEQINHMITQFKTVTHELGGDVSFKTDTKSVGYHFEEENDLVKQVAQVISQMGRSVTYEISGGGSDANVFNANGKEALNLSIGYEKIHTTNEYLPITELIKAVELAYQLVIHVR